MAIDRISSRDVGYLPGDLSTFPTAIDTDYTLYHAVDNAETVLTQSITYTSKTIFVEDASSFPARGICRIGRELIYYDSRNNESLRDLVRGFADSRRQSWQKDEKVLCIVAAEHHNALADAIINIENTLGVKNNPDDKTSLNGILSTLELKFLSPRPLFRAVPRKGVAPLQVAFKNLSSGYAIRFFWDFGDGTTSVEDEPVHTYTADGTYTVVLNMINQLGGTGVVKKIDYITIGETEAPTFFYVEQSSGTTSTLFEFVDQSLGQIKSRYWVWDDGQTLAIEDADVHTATHTYSLPGIYRPSLLIVFNDDRTKKIDLGHDIIVV